MEDGQLAETRGTRQRLTNMENDMNDINLSPISEVGSTPRQIAMEDQLRILMRSFQLCLIPEQSAH